MHAAGCERHCLHSLVYRFRCLAIWEWSVQQRCKLVSPEHRQCTNHCAVHSVCHCSLCQCPVLLVRRRFLFRPPCQPTLHPILPLSSSPLQEFHDPCINQHKDCRAALPASRSVSDFPVLCGNACRRNGWHTASRYHRVSSTHQLSTLLGC